MILLRQVFYSSVIEYIQVFSEFVWVFIFNLVFGPIFLFYSGLSTLAGLEQLSGMSSHMLLTIQVTWKKECIVKFQKIGKKKNGKFLHVFKHFYLHFLGRMYDKYGNFGVQWWTNRSVEQYKKRGECMVHHYSKFAYFGKNVS